MADDTERGLAAYPVPLPENPFTNPDLREKSTLGFLPDPMAEKVRGLPARLLQNADENLTKNIMAYMPKPKESRYGSIRMPRASDDPMNAGAFIMAGPIAVEEALGRFAAKALPAKTIETKLLQMGASKAELEARGVMDYLAAQGTRPVHPLEVMKHLDENPYQPFADLPGPKPKVSPTPPPIPAATKKVDLHAEAAALDPANPVRYVGEQMGYPMMQQEPPGVGSFIIRPGETAATAFARAKARYQK